MIEIPEVGFDYSVYKSNINANVLGDWLEANILFRDPAIAKSDVVDILIEYQICPDEKQDLAHQIASAGWDELARRKRWGGIPPTVSISSSRLEAHEDWQATPMWSFFVLLSSLRILPEWASKHQDHSNQGNLFEEVVEAVCPALFPGWNSYRAGWSPKNAQNIPAIVEELCNRLYVSGAADLSEWVSPSAKDGGLDIVCYRQFEDQREAMPVFFLQCASGKNWRQKVTTPNAASWQKYLNSAVIPSTGIVAPFVIEKSELKRAALDGQIVVFDRLRMLSAARAYAVRLEGGLLRRVLKWMQPRVADIPRAA